MPRDIWEYAADLKTALPVLPELERRLHQIADRPVVRTDGEIPVVGHSVILGQRRLRIVRVHLARGSVHEQKDHMLGFGREVRFPFHQKIRQLGRPGARFEESVAGEKVEESQHREARPDMPDEPTTGLR